MKIKVSSNSPAKFPLEVENFTLMNDPTYKDIGNGKSIKNMDSYSVHFTLKNPPENDPGVAALNEAAIGHNQGVIFIAFEKDNAYKEVKCVILCFKPFEGFYEFAINDSL